MYSTLAEVYEWLVPEQLRTPEGSAAAFEHVVAELPANGRVLDCAAGTGELAVGLALRGFDVVATDASPRMLDKARALARERGVEVEVGEVAWAQLGDRVSHDFDAVFCVGNSLTHSGARAGRREALGQMAKVLKPGGTLVVTSRNWELVRAAGSGIRVAERVAERDGRRALVVHGWTIALGWDDAHQLDVAVALLGDDGAVTTHHERLTFWPFRHEQLTQDLSVTGLTQASSSYAPEAERYLVRARK